MADLKIILKNSRVDDIIKLKDEAVKRALETIGIQVQNYATALCPHDTGRLEGSITYATVSNHSEPRAPAGGGDDVGSAPDDKSVVIGTRVNYAAYVEYGTSRYPHPRPFLKPAFMDHQTEYKQIIEENLQDVK